MGIQKGPLSRTRKSEKKYIEHRKNNPQKDCVLCSQDASRLGKIYEDHKDYYVLENLFPYDIWDGCDVDDHLMMVPKKHTDSLSSLSKAAKCNIMDALADYEAKGYSIYARAPKNMTKSIVHQHTHLIKVGQHRKKMLIYLRKPHLLIFK